MSRLLKAVACGVLAGLAFGLVSLATTVGKSAASWTAATDWVQGAGSRIRMIGAELTVDGAPRLVAGIQIELEAGWKTYWRSPGDAGGIPPVFDWDQSKQLGKAVLLYPAPRRLADPEGVSIGYKKHVVFPIEVTASGSAPVELVLGAFYGICREICIPAEAELSLRLVPATAVDPAIAAALEAALAEVPRALANDALPRIEAVSLTTAGEGGEMLIDARFDPSTADASLFVEAEDGSYVPVPEKVADDGGGLLRFRARFKSKAEAAALAGVHVVLTIVSDKGHAEVRRRID